MSDIRRPKGPPPLADRRLTSAADLRGNADGTASPAELAGLASDLAGRPNTGFDRDDDARAARARVLAAETGPAGAPTLDPVLAALPGPVRRLALQLDALWGDADGQLTVAEIDRVAGHYLSAVAFFFDDAERLLDLAGRLGLTLEESLPEAGNLLALRGATANADAAAIEGARPYRVLLDQAIASADIPGAPELLRDASLHSPMWHQLSILDHTTSAVRAIDDLLEHMGIEWPEAPAIMLLHDVGKVLDRVTRPDRGDQQFSYFDHEEAGARWLEARGIDGDFAFHVRHHMVVRPSSADEVRELVGENRTRLARMLIVYCADDVAKGNLPREMASFQQNHDKIRALAADAGLDGERLIARAMELKSTWFADVPRPAVPD